MFNSFANNSNMQLEIIEIGPGLGDLSARLLDYYSLVAYEIDDELCCYLHNRFPNDRFILYNKDVLQLDFIKSGWLSKNPYLLVSNLPYYIATKIILNLFRDNKCKGMVVMTQKEVAQKFCANAGESNFSALGILAQSISDKIELIADIPSSAFNPPPKVESSIFSISKNDCEIEENFEHFIKDAFKYRKKKLCKNLANIKNINSILSELEIDKNSRPHQISTLKYHQIFNKIKDCYGRK